MDLVRIHLPGEASSCYAKQESAVRTNSFLFLPLAMTAYGRHTLTKTNESTHARPADG